MASWEDYIQLHLINTGHVNQAMIMNKKDGRCWATTPEFHLRKYTAPVSVEGAGGATVIKDEEVNELVNLIQYVGEIVHRMMSLFSLCKGAISIILPSHYVSLTNHLYGMYGSNWRGD